MTRVFAIVAAILAVVAPVAPQADPLEHRWESAMISGSGRLAVFSIMQERPSGAKGFVGAFMRRNGLLHREGGGAERVGGFVSARPLVEHDRNINSGIPAKSVTLGGLRFVIDEEDRAKKGLLFGAQISAGTDFSIHKGQVLSFGGQLAYQYSFEHNMDKKYAGTHSCLSSHFGKWNWVDACLGARLLEKGSRLEEGYASLGYTRLFGSPIADHEAEFKLQQAWRKDYDKLTLGYSLTSAMQEIGAVGVSLRLGERIRGKHTTLIDGSLSLTRPIFDRLSTVSFDHRYEAGSQFFGEDRQDHVAIISFSTELNDRFSASLSYEKVNSTAAIYDGESLIFGIGVTGFRF